MLSALALVNERSQELREAVQGVESLRSVEPGQCARVPSGNGMAAGDDEVLRVVASSGRVRMDAVTLWTVWPTTDYRDVLRRESTLAPADWTLGQPARGGLVEGGWLRRLVT